LSQLKNPAHVFGTRAEDETGWQSCRENHMPVKIRQKKEVSQGKYDPMIELKDASVESVSQNEMSSS